MSRRTKQQHVLNRLLDANGDWVCSRILHHPMVGGRAARSRVSDLKRDGYPIESKNCYCHQCRYYRERAEARHERGAYVAAYRIPAEWARAHRRAQAVSA